MQIAVIIFLCLTLDLSSCVSFTAANPFMYCPSLPITNRHLATYSKTRFHVIHICHPLPISVTVNHRTNDTFTATGRGAAKTDVTSNGTLILAEWSQGPRATVKPLLCGEDGFDPVSYELVDTGELESLSLLVLPVHISGMMIPGSRSYVMWNCRVGSSIAATSRERGLGPRERVTRG